MELEEMKNAWQEMDARLEKQTTITTKILEKMTTEKYNSKLNKIGYSEYIGSLICCMGAIYLLLNFTKIDDAMMQGFGIVAILMLLILPIISIQSLRSLKNVNVAANTYLESIQDFGRRKVRFQKLQNLNVSLAFFLLIVSIPVLSAIQGKDLSQNPYFWPLIFPLAIAFFLVFALWVLRFYNKTLNESEKILADNND